jgi:NAD(P)H-nitrite reductase large subunit
VKLQAEKIKFMNLIIIGGGYAGLSLAQQVRELDSQIKITILNQEPFCSRPNLFFRFKFPHWHDKHFDYTAGMNIVSDEETAFRRKYNVEILDDHTALKINNNQTVSALNKKTNETVNLNFDKLCLTIGGKPNIVSFSTVKEEQENNHVFFNTLQYDNYVNNIENVFAVRNIEEIQLLYNAIRQLHDENAIKNIIVVGSGALSLDIVTHIIDGYEAVWKHHHNNQQQSVVATQSKFQVAPKEIIWSLDDIKLDQLPKITIIARKSTIAHPLLQDIAASEMITKMVSTGTDHSSDDKTKFQISDYVQLVTEDNIESIIVSQQKSTRGQSACTGVRTQKDKVIPCSIVIQAVGVNSNTQLASDSGLLIGEKGGIVVNENFQCFEHETSSSFENIYAAGDCAELRASYVGGIHDKQTVVWKNWTSAREQAVECAHAIVNSGKKPNNLWFNQTTKLFGLFVACLGMYHHEEKNNEESIVVKSQQTSGNHYFKLVFHSIADNKKKLIGSLVIGPDMTDYKLGSSVLDVLKQGISFSSDFTHNMIQLSATQWTCLVKTVKENRKNNIDTLSTDQEQQIMTTVASTVKKVNPLTAKKNPVARKNPVASKKQVPTQQQVEVQQVEQQLNNLSLDH